MVYPRLRLIAVNNEEQMLVLEKGKHGGQMIRRVKNACEPSKVLHEFTDMGDAGGECCFVGDSLYFVGLLDTDEFCLMELEFSADGLLHEKRRAVLHGVPACTPAPQFLGHDI